MSDIHLVYTSRAVTPLSASDLETLTQQASVRNAALGITGVLLYGGGRFCQLLEGESDIVKDLYHNKIASDDRHEDCRVMLTRACESRLFPDWSMGRLYLQRTEGVAQQSWDALCAEIGRQNHAAIFAREPAAECLDQFLKHFARSEEHARHAPADNQFAKPRPSKRRKAS